MALRSLNQMVAFVAAADAGGYSAAAKRLGVTTEAVRRAVLTAEADAGLQLLAPTSRAFGLTDAGEAYLEGCRKVLAAVAAVERTLAGYRGAPTGRLRVSMPFALGRLHIVPAMGGFLDRHPDVEVEVMFIDRPVDAVEESVDVVFQAQSQGDPRLVLRTLGVPALRMVASPAYLARRGTPGGLADLEGGRHECIGLLSPESGTLSPWHILEAHGRWEKRGLPGRTVVNNNEAGLAAAVAGLGLAQLPDDIAGQALAAGDLVEVLPEHRRDAAPLSIGYPRGRTLPTKVQAFVDYFVVWFAPRTPGVDSRSHTRRD